MIPLNNTEGDYVVDTLIYNSINFKFYKHGSSKQNFRTFYLERYKNIL